MSIEIVLQRWLTDFVSLDICKERGLLSTIDWTICVVTSFAVLTWNGKAEHHLTLGAPGVTNDPRCFFRGELLQ